MTASATRRRRRATAPTALGRSAGSRPRASRAARSTSCSTSPRPMRGATAARAVRLVASRSRRDCAAPAACGCRSLYPPSCSSRRRAPRSASRAGCDVGQPRGGRQRGGARARRARPPSAAAGRRRAGVRARSRRRARSRSRASCASRAPAAAAAAAAAARARPRPRRARAFGPPPPPLLAPIRRRAAMSARRRRTSRSRPPTTRARGVVPSSRGGALLPDRAARASPATPTAHPRPRAERAGAARRESARGRDRGAA